MARSGHGLASKCHNEARAAADGFGIAHGPAVAVHQLPHHCQADAGAYVAITRPSGCGKSTLLSMLGLLDTPDSGEFWFDGHNVVGWTEMQLDQLRRGRIGFIFQRGARNKRRRPSIFIGATELPSDLLT